jgi:predicted O-methyltransferase YrrM
MGMAETGNLLFLKLLLKNPKKARYFPGEVFRAYMSLAREDRWACRSIFELVPECAGRRVVLEHLPGDGVLTPLEQLACLALITASLRPKAIFEIGTFRGRTALNFALNSPKECTVYTLDLPLEKRRAATGAKFSADEQLMEASAPGIEYEDKDVAFKIEQLFGDSLDFDFSPYHQSVDIVYVDGSHHYDAVCSDTRNALKMVRPGGCVIWDEFANYGEYNDVTRAVLDVLGAEKIVHVENTQLAVHFADPS